MTDTAWHTRIEAVLWDHVGPLLSASAIAALVLDIADAAHELSETELPGSPQITDIEPKPRW